MFITKEDKTDIEKDIRKLFIKLIDKISLEHPYVKEIEYQEYTPLITNSLSVQLNLNNNKITVEDLKQEFAWYIKRMDIKLLNYFGNEELKKEILNFGKCAVNIDVSLKFEEKTRFTFNYVYNYMVSVLKGKGMEELIKLEDLAYRFYGYDRSKWELQHIFSSEIKARDIMNGREGSYKTFMTYEFLRFEEKWSDFLNSKDRELKSSYKKSLTELFKEVKRGDYKWLQLS